MNKIALEKNRKCRFKLNLNKKKKSWNSRENKQKSIGNLKLNKKQKNRNGSKSKMTGKKKMEIN